MYRKAFIGFVTTVTLVVLPAGYSGVSASEESKTDWSKPETIDPMDPGISELLNTDFVAHVRRARELFEQRKFEEAAQYYLFVLRSKYDDFESAYNLACCYGHLGKADRAAEFLDRAVGGGFQDFEHIEKDPSFQKVRGNGNFKKTLKKIQKWREVLGRTIYIKSTQFAKTRIRLPREYDDAKSYPLVIGLHGNGGNAEDFVTLGEYFKDHDFIYAAPEAPYLRPRSVALKGQPRSWILPEPSDYLRNTARPLTEDYILEVADRVSGLYYVTDIYLLGFSQGAGFAYSAGIKHPDVFKGIISCSGRLPDTIPSGDLTKAHSHLRVFISYGKKERSYERGVEARDRLQKLGYDVTFVDFDGGHEIPRDILKRAAKWIKESN